MATEPFPPLPTNTQPAVAAPCNPIQSVAGGAKAPLTFGSEGERNRVRWEKDQFVL